MLLRSIQGGQARPHQIRSKGLRPTRGRQHLTEHCKHDHSPMKTIALLAIVLTLASSPAADKPAPEFPKTGETYKISTASPLAESPYENRVTVLALGEHQWAKIQYEVATRAGGKDKKEMWVNFAHVTSAVKVIEAAK
jgi:hypothetical protein